MNSLNVKTHQPHGIKTIEASAGTGKTYTIKILYVKALVQLWKKSESLGIANILVVTFTEAATKELRSRIRETLQLFLEYLEGKASSNEAEMQSLTTYFESIIFTSEDEKVRFISYLKSELKNPDQASIYTIHGFCRTIISTFPFECGISGQFEITSNLTEELNDCVFSEWRTIVRSTDVFSHYVESNFGSPKDLLKTFGRVLLGSIRLKHNVDTPNIVNGLYEEFKKNKEYFLQEFSDEDCSRLVIQLFTSPWLNGNKYQSETGYKLAEEMKVFRNQPFNFELLNKSELISIQAVECNVKKGHVASLSDELRHFLEVYETIHTSLSALQAKKKEVSAYYLAHLQQVWHQHKKRKGLFGFDDLLTIVKDALTQNPDLVARLQQDYPFGFIDEFQDTDPIQFRIFELIYVKDPTQTEGFYIIGDPKQSIYSFRNADLNTYLYARNLSDEIYVLNTNYRSLAQTVQSVNTFYLQSQNPFLQDEITFQEVQYQKEGELISSNLAFQKPMIWVSESSNTDSTPSGKKKSDVIRTTIKLVQYYLSGNVQFQSKSISKRPIQPGDIAVLVKTNKQADRVYRAFRKAAIPAVIYSKKTVFATDEAHYIAIVMQAILAAQESSAVKTALLTPFFSFTLPELSKLEQEENGLLAIQEKFLAARKLWFRRGVSAAFSFIANTFEVLKNLLQFGEGDRSIANWNHLIDLIGRYERESRRNPYRTLQLVQEKIAEAQLNDSGSSEDELLRLESNDDKVKIVTIHSSKGLQYPIVIQPYAWQSRSVPNAQKKNQVCSISVRKQADSQPEVLRLFANESVEQLQKNYARLSYSSKNAGFSEIDAETENIYATHEEEARQFYVALTRAEWQNVLIVPEYKFSGNQRSMLEIWAKSYLESSLRNEKNELFLGYESIKKACLSLYADFPNYYEWITDIPEAKSTHHKWLENGINHLEKPLERTKILKADFHTSSYSSIVSELGHVISQKDEQISESFYKGDEILSIHSIKAGAEIGNVIHNVMEHIQTDELSCIERLVQSEINKLGYNALFDSSLQLISRWMQRIYTEKIILKDDISLSISELSPNLQKREMEFLLSSSDFNVEKLIKIIRDETISSTLFEKGFIKGFIDLLFIHKNKFYLLDYKSNQLGKNETYYTNENLQNAMVEFNYDVQMAIYSLALHHYLQVVIQNYDYDKHFGGMVYWFVRGIDAPGKGVHFHKISFEKLMDLESCLIKGEYV